MSKTPHFLRVLAGVVLAVGVVGGGIAVLPAMDRGVTVAPPSAPPVLPGHEPAAPQPVVPPAAPAPAAAAPATGQAPTPTLALPRQDDTLFREYFENGVEYLRQGRPHEALVSFNAATYLRPHVPEAFVNIGYSHLEMDQHEDAASAFAHALEINPSQTNAYYGLAIALEGLQRLEEALGAMRTFEHLLPQNETKFRRMATAAIWEWETALRSRGASPPPPAPDTSGETR